MMIVIETSMGTIKAELWADKSPKTVKNFLQYIDDSFFDGLVFHRVIDGFMIQGGGFDQSMNQKETRAAVKNEASADAINTRGTLAMARTSDVHSATAQFFINLVDNDFLDYKNDTDQGFGYCVFGEVTEGLDVVDAIGKVKTAAQDVPVEHVVITSISKA
jgi:peptidyl-prolyl cis-trans isomerase B (cyclophilin B)